MAISYSFTGVRHARALLAEIAECGVEPPKVLTDLIGAFDDLAKASAVSDPIGELVKAVAGGQLRGKELDKRVAETAVAMHVAEFRAGLQARVEPVLVRQFINALDEGGAADEVIDSLRPAFDTAATKLAECAELVNPNTDAETFLASASPEQIAAWRDVDEHVATLTKVSSVVGNFGPHSNSFPLLEVPANLTNVGFINNIGTLCVDPQWDLGRACALFQKFGSHRNSPWFRGASMLRLNSIAEAREKIRAWAESSWDAMNINQGRGILDPDRGFIPTPIRNPFAKAEATTS